MRYYALVQYKNCERESDDYKAWKFIHSDLYDNKKTFLKELRANGYIVKRSKIYTEQEYMAI